MTTCAPPRRNLDLTPQYLTRSDRFYLLPYQVLLPISLHYCCYHADYYHRVSDHTIALIASCQQTSTDDHR